MKKSDLIITDSINFTRQSSHLQMRICPPIAFWNHSLVSRNFLSQSLFSAHRKNGRTKSETKNDQRKKNKKWGVSEGIFRNDLPKFYDTHYMMPPITNREITKNQVNLFFKHPTIDYMNRFTWQDLINGTKPTKKKNQKFNKLNGYSYSFMPNEASSSLFFICQKDGRNNTENKITKLKYQNQ